MEKDLVGGKIGSVGQYDVAFSGGKLKVSASVTEFVEFGASVSVGADQVIDALEKAIPNVILKEVFEAIRAALKA